MGLISHKR